jgi:hypothetical protein
LVSPADSCQAVSNGDGCDLTLQIVECLNDCCLSFSIQRTCGLVQDEQFGARVKGSRDTEPLPLTSRETNAALSDGGVKPFSRFSEEFRYPSAFKRLPHEVVINLFGD